MFSQNVVQVLQYFLFSDKTNRQIFAISFKIGVVAITQPARISSNSVSNKTPRS